MAFNLSAQERPLGLGDRTIPGLPKLCAYLEKYIEKVEKKQAKKRKH
jgi:hypothetical protein